MMPGHSCFCGSWWALSTDLRLASAAFPGLQSYSSTFLQLGCNFSAVLRLLLCMTRSNTAVAIQRGHYRTLNSVRSIVAFFSCHKPHTRVPSLAFDISMLASSCTGGLSRAVCLAAILVARLGASGVVLFQSHLAVLATAIDGGCLHGPHSDIRPSFPLQSLLPASLPGFLSYTLPAPRTHALCSPVGSGASATAIGSMRL